MVVFFCKYKYYANTHKPYIGTWSIDAQRAVQIAQCMYGWTRKKDPYSDPMSGDGFSPHA